MMGSIVVCKTRAWMARSIQRRLSGTSRPMAHVRMGGSARSKLASDGSTCQMPWVLLGTAFVPTEFSSIRSPTPRTGPESTVSID